MLPRTSWDRGRALAVVAALAAAAGCARAPGVPAVTTVPKVAASEGLAHVETSDPRLRDSLARLYQSPTALAPREVAAAYRDLGIADRAFDHLRATIAIDPRDAGARDMLARIWRDWGLPELGLADARAAVKAAPRSPVTHNTLGTLFEALGRFDEARRAYERALALDGGAAYALTNLTRLPAIAHGRAQAGREHGEPAGKP